MSRSDRPYLFAFVLVVVSAVLVATMIGTPMSKKLANLEKRIEALEAKP